MEDGDVARALIGFLCVRDLLLFMFFQRGSVMLPKFVAPDEAMVLMILLKKKDIVDPFIPLKIHLYMSTINFCSKILYYAFIMEQKWNNSVHLTESYTKLCYRRHRPADGEPPSPYEFTTATFFSTSR